MSEIYAYVKRICISDIDINIFVRNRSISEINAYSKYMDIRNIYVCQKYMHVRNIYACQKYVPIFSEIYDD